MSDNKLFKFAGIVTDGKGRTKVRFGNDIVARIKILVKMAKATRMDLVELPVPMNKIDSSKYLATLEQFSSRADQATIADALSMRENKIAKAAKFSASYANASSIDGIRRRGRPRKIAVTVADVLGATVEA